MERIAKQKEIHKVISDGFKEVISFKTKDGQEFENEHEALKHESDLLRKENFDKNFKVHHIWLSDEQYICLFISDFSEETKKEIRCYFWKFPFEDCKLGWNLVQVDDSGDYTYTYCFDPKKLIEERKNDITILEGLLTND